MTPAKIEAWIDNEQMVNVETAGKKIDMRAGEIELSVPFGLASFRTEGGASRTSSCAASPRERK